MLYDTRNERAVLFLYTHTLEDLLFCSVDSEILSEIFIISLSPRLHSRSDTRRALGSTKRSKSEEQVFSIHDGSLTEVISHFKLW